MNGGLPRWQVDVASGGKMASPQDAPCVACMTALRLAMPRFASLASRRRLWLRPTANLAPPLAKPRPAQRPCRLWLSLARMASWHPIAGVDGNPTDSASSSLAKMFLLCRRLVPQDGVDHGSISPRRHANIASDCTLPPWHDDAPPEVMPARRRFAPPSRPRHPSQHFTSLVSLRRLSRRFAWLEKLCRLWL